MTTASQPLVVDGLSVRYGRTVAVDGVGFIGRDLVEGRLGFYFAQPLSGPTICFGKLAAVLLLVSMVQAIIMLSTLVLAARAGDVLRLR